MIEEATAFLEQYRDALTDVECLLDDVVSSLESFSSGSAVPAGQLLDIYSAREAHYRKRGSSATLLAETSALVRALGAAVGDVELSCIQFTDGRTISFFRESDGKLLGALRSVDARKVAHRQLDQLWGRSDHNDTVR